MSLLDKDILVDKQNTTGALTVSKSPINNSMRVNQLNSATYKGNNDNMIIKDSPMQSENNSAKKDSKISNFGVSQI